MKKLFLVFICLGFLGFAVGKDRYDDLQVFAKVLNLVQKYYVEPVETKTLIYGGIKGLLGELDPHTNFLPPDIFKEFESETSGQFGGLGVEITVQQGVLTVISPIEDTPAWKAGIKAGDKVVTINGLSTKGMSLVEAAKHMRGKRGSQIVLGVMREGLDDPKDITIVRGTVNIKSVKYEDLSEGYAYAKITHFIENTFRDLNASLASHKKKHKAIRGLILDLRRNPGGLLDQAVKVSDLFLESGDIVSTVDRSKKDPEILSAHKEGTLEPFPLVVLIDEYSASASEIVAGALKDNKRALVVGQRSFGKGSVQSVVKLGDGSGLKLTVARYYTPSGRSIQAEGIGPDVLVANLDQKLIDSAQVKRKVKREKDISGHLEGEAEKNGQTPAPQSSVSWSSASISAKVNAKARKLLEQDFQLLQAYNYLKAWSVVDQMGKVPDSLKK